MPEFQRQCITGPKRFALAGAALALCLTAFQPVSAQGSAAGARGRSARPEAMGAAVIVPFDSPGDWQPAAPEAHGAGASAVITGAGASSHPLPAGLSAGISPGAPVSQNSLKVKLNLPSAAGIMTTPGREWNRLSGLRFAVFLPADAPSTLSLGVYVKDNEWWWYESFPLRAAAAARGVPELAPGQWNVVKVDLSPEADGWAPGGHLKPWNDAMTPFLEVGLLFYSKVPYHGGVEISPMVGLTSHGEAGAGPPAVESASISENTVEQWRSVTITMDVDRRYSNPFDPAVVDVEGHFDGAMGEVTIPGFIYQDYYLPEGSKQPVPRGGAVWKVRFTPTRPGSYHYVVTLKDSAGTSTLTTGRFSCKAAHDHGFVRIDENDHRFFGFDDNSWYYPIGLNVRHAGDNTHVHEGLPAIEHYFDKMASVELNWTRTWMASWWLAIEWSHKYDARYHGVGRYNLANAWMLDKTLDAAARDGLYVDLTLNNHGQLSATSDHEWEMNPYNVVNGGRLAQPAEFFSDPWARKMFEQRVRYIVARWGYSTHIFAWELFNEVDLTEGYHSAVVSEWMSEMSDYIHSLDPWQHLVSTHVCWWKADPVIWSNPKLQFVQADAYVRWTHGQDTMATFTDKVWQYKARFDKPAYVVEFGYKNSTENGDPEKDPIPQFHPGIWAGFMSPFSADSMFWDWYVVDQQDLWPQYAALVRFARGEDRRGQDLKVALCSVDSTAPMGADGINNHDRAYVWVYDSERLGQNDPSKFAPVPGAKLELDGLDDGEYNVEYWDTFKGDIIGTAQGKSANGQLSVALPPVRIDIAIKIKRK